MSSGSGGTGSGLGAQLYGLLPEVYRTRDNGDLRDYLGSCGEVLDLVRGVMAQRLADAFPDHPDAQGWTLPYLAELLDVKLLSPAEPEQRRELSQAVSLRQRKGTPGSVVQVAQDVGQYAWDTEDPRNEPSEPVYLQEGWRRVAVTPRVGQPLLPPESLGALPLPAGAPARRHPALPAATVDLRYLSRKVALPPRGDGSSLPPLQENVHGIPAAPGHFDDVSRRTPDLRRPSARQGQVHPKRVAVFTLPRVGFFPPGWEFGDTRPLPVPAEPSRVLPRRRQGPLTPEPESGDYVLENLVLPEGEDVIVGNRPLVMRNCVVQGNVYIDAFDTAHVIEDSIVTGMVTKNLGNELVVRRSAFGRLQLEAGTPDVVGATVEDSLLGSLESTALITLLSVTVLGSMDVARCFANDSLFAGSVTPRPGVGNCFRYCRLPEATLGAYTVEGQPAEAYACTSEVPRFRATVFGAPGAGVLASDSGARLLDGAEDGGELGAYRHRRYALRDEAVLARLRESLPAGMSAILVPDERLGLALPVVTPPST
ncbi:phage tail protein [Corallococcus exiguus]|uniref:Phage tail protein n=1 Tax=Corallococcus exiguus TaxID=83462 RepID=A0A7X5BU85_9BACT|nr:phage tail protein [Corallococcus exiguus]NBC43829.1 hypothetical protein [Corallococcus exiguus]TNV53977.1 hypothetical protein FH620_34170 [Corallococcus exiguus]